MVNFGCEGSNADLVLDLEHVAAVMDIPRFVEIAPAVVFVHRVFSSLYETQMHQKQNLHQQVSRHVLLTTHLLSQPSIVYTFCVVCVPIE